MLCQCSDCSEKLILYRQHDRHASLASVESSPDESLIAEGWIVAGTIMSNRDYKPGKHDLLDLEMYVEFSWCRCTTTSSLLVSDPSDKAKMGFSWL